MMVTLLLADFAQAIDNKLYIMGGGWSLIGPDPTPFGIAIKIEVPWDQTNTKHKWELSLLDSDGNPATVGTAEELGTVEVSGEYEVGRPPGLAPGTPIDLTLAINFSPLPLAPGQRYVWRLSIDGHADEDWQAAFSTRPRPK